MFEQFGNIFSILMNLAGLMACLFYFVRRPQRAWSYSIIFLLCALLSNYYWGIYALVMGDDPNTSSLLAYVGWDLAYLMLIMLLRETRCDEEKHFFSIFSLLPIPLNIYQFMLYLPFGGLVNNIIQVGTMTVIPCLCINSICYYIKNRKNKARLPYVAVLVLIYTVLEFTMWTSSCFDWPSDWLYPYNYASILSCFTYALLPFTIAKNLGVGKETDGQLPESRLQKMFKPLYFAFVTIMGVGGLLLAIWMRDTLTAGIGELGETGDTDPYSVIAVVLFVVSIVIMSFTVITILLISFERKAAENAANKEAKAIAERSNAAKSDFLANMSHEIRTPINAVLGMNEMIIRESLSARNHPPESPEELEDVFADIGSYAGNIDSAGKSLLSIINDILDFSKIEAGRMELVDGEYKLSTLLHDVCNMISYKARDKGLSFLVSVEDTLPETLYGDEVRVRQVIINLLNNAIKYTNEGSVSLTVVGQEHVLENGERITDLIVSIKDTGIGIRKEDIAKLFSKFERVDLEKNSTVEGTGLGLAITKSLLEMMGGNIRLDSTYGEGSEFTATIPQKIISDEKIGDFMKRFEENAAAPENEREAFYAPDAHILVVDDTRMNLLVVKGLLKDTGIRIDTAESGAESIEYAKKNRYDMILMDQRMPQMDGTMAMQMIREDKEGKNADTPFICLTADAVTGARERYVASGFEDYLTKPINSRELEEMIIRYLPEDMIRKKVIDRAAGIHYSADDEGIYRDVMREYVRESERKTNALETYLEEADWKNYGIIVHSLKSSSKTIGAAELSALAARMEMAADAGDADTIRNGHEEMMECYRCVVDEAIKLIDGK